MEKTIIASFATRHSAERAVEHLVQEHGVERTDIFIAAAGEANSKEGSGNPIEISVDCKGVDSATVEAALKETGATSLRGH